MSILTYVAIQGLILICYGSYVAYRAGYSNGYQKGREDHDL